MISSRPTTTTTTHSLLDSIFFENASQAYMNEHDMLMQDDSGDDDEIDHQHSSLLHRFDLSLITHYQSHLDQQLTQLMMMHGGSSDNVYTVHQLQADVQMLTDEKNTWSLLKSLLSEEERVVMMSNEEQKQFLASRMELEQKRRMHESHPFLPDYGQLTQLAIKSDMDLRRVQLIVQWLESTAGPLMKSTHMPAEEEEDEDGFSQVQQHVEFKLWENVRSGSIEGAQEYCRRNNQFSRAATLALANEYQKAKLIRPGRLESGEEVNSFQRDMFLMYLSTLVKITAEDRGGQMNADARLYGALCGHLQLMLQASSCWQDQLWAYLREKVEYRLNELVHRAKQHAARTNRPLTDIMAAVGTTPVPLQSMQQSIILGEPCMEGLRRMCEEQNGASMNPHFLRFACHYALLNTSVGESEDKDCIILAYVDHLIRTHQYQMVPFYVSRLSLDAPNVFSSFLDDASQHCYNDEIREILDSAKQYMRREDIMDGLQLFVNKSIETMTDPVWAIKWAVFSQYPELYEYILKCCNQIVSKCLNSIGESLELLPKAYEHIDNIQHLLPQDIWGYSGEHEREFIFWTNYVNASLCYCEWLEHVREEVHEIPMLVRDTFGLESENVLRLLQKRQYDLNHKQWSEDERRLRDNAAKSMRDLLKHDSEWRLRQKSALISRVITFTVFNLFQLYMSSTQFQECHNLINLVADECYCLYTHFSKAQLFSLLKLMKEAELRYMRHLSKVDYEDPIKYPIVTAPKTIETD